MTRAHDSANVLDLDYASIRRGIRDVAPPEAAIEDIEQECCLRILRKRHLCNPSKGSRRGWIRVLARNVAINFLSRLRRERPAAVSVPRMPEESPAPDEIHWAREEFSRLPLSQRQALLLRFYHDRSTAEIARILGISRPAAAERIDRALERLRKHARSGGLLGLTPYLTGNGFANAEVLLMSAQQKVAVTALACLFIGAAGTTFALRPARGASEADGRSLAAENTRLKSEILELREKQLPALQAELVRLRTERDSEGSVGLGVGEPSLARQGRVDAPDAAAEQLPPRAGLPAGIRTAKDVAEMLGLDPSRAAYFTEGYDRILSSLRQAEKFHAETSQEGKMTRIHIPPFPEEARAISDEWLAHLETVLSADERHKYDRFQFDGALFPRGNGGSDRWIEFEPRENAAAILFNEQWGPPGQKPNTHWKWGGGPALDFYQHLLE